MFCHSGCLKTATRERERERKKRFKRTKLKYSPPNHLKIITTWSIRGITNIRFVFYYSLLWRPRKLGTYSFSRHSAKLFQAPYLPTILSFPNKWENTIQLRLQGCMFPPCTPRLNSKTRTRKLLMHGRKPKFMGCLYSATWVHVLWAHLWRKRLSACFYRCNHESFSALLDVLVLRACV